MEGDLEEQRRMVLETADRLTEARKLYEQGLELLGQGRHLQAGEHISRAAEMGDSTAQCQLGELYDNGFFGEPDACEAARWYRQSAEQFHPHGQFRLGACYQLGKGVPQDGKEAARLFEMAARRGHMEAADCLLLLRDGL
jgi:TPR repeat protein